MPLISVKMTKEDGGATIEQKEELALGITELFSKIFQRPAKNAVVLIEELDMEDYFIGGKSVKKIREEAK